MKWVFFLCGLSFLLFGTCRSANIVAYMPLPFYSHQTAFKPLWLELAKKGHKITLIQSQVVVENNENITHILLNDTYRIMNKGKMFDNLGKGQSIVTVLLAALSSQVEVMEYQLSHPGVQDLLKGENKVDLFFTEFLATYGIPLRRKLNASMIGLVSMDSSIHGHLYVGNPTHPVMYPDKDMPFYPALTFKERVIDTFFWVAFKLLMDFIFNPMMERVAAKCLGEVDPLEDIAKEVSLLFINANPLFNAVRPLGPKTVNIGGGLHLLEPQPLPRDLQDYLDNAEYGVIYFSLGSNINSKQLPNITKKIILETFSQLPYKILWKFNEEIPGKSNNVKVMKWIPQQDVLRHKNVKLFITQGGLQSMEEAIFNYVPMLALPFYGDQNSNARKMAAKGIGLTLDYKKLNVESFKSAILEVLDNSRYRETTKELADLVMDQPMTGLEKAVWWTEYVLRHGRTEHFRDRSVDTPWYQFLLLDVISFVLAAAAVAIYVFVKTLRLLKWSVCKLHKTLTDGKKTKTN
ncbi:UDP-glucuronosyltransferase 2B16-like isoform X1 [Anoplophora glabripennis]|uniref:UDP-glucuronosyltransferase 2B16-like isoform X1 n=1 Tax=Anoplophora glabripennis TaxID=217634 RepID=UPI000C760FEE|nr:UDP-glucuronosyltransferase 2B16-like isoform X1 [Anoplophora glabripennis]